MQPQQPRPDAPYVWGEEKLRARCNRLLRQLAVIEADQEAATQAFARKMQELGQRRAACLLELTMADLYAAAADPSGKPDAAAPAPVSSAQAASPIGTTVATSSDLGSEETPTLPDYETDPGSGEQGSASPAIEGHGPESADGSALPNTASAAPADPEAEHSVLDPETVHALVEASAPSWLDVGKPPLSVRERFPLYDRPLASLDVDHLDLNELLPRLASVHPDLVGAAPVFKNHLPDWYRSEDGAACRVALEQAIEREVIRRDLWSDLLEWYGCVLAVAPGGYLGTTTPRQAEETYDRLQAAYREALSPGRTAVVWSELTTLMPGRPWFGAGIAMEVSDQGDLYDMPDDGSSGTSAYEDDDDPEDAGPT